MENALVATKLSKHFGSFPSFQALEDINLSLPRGACLGVAGPNGAGKSTLLKVLFGLYPISGGEAVVLGYSLSEYSHKIRKLVGYVPDTSAFSWERVGFLVKYFAFLHGYGLAEAKKRATNALKEYEMQDAQHKRYRQLSEGMKKRILFALAAAHECEMLLLDEPTANLDLSGRQKVEGLVRSYARAGKTVILVTHRARQIERVCSHLVVLLRGRIGYSGKVEELVDRMYQGEMLIPNQSLDRVEIKPLEIDRLHLRSLGRYTIVPKEYWDEFLGITKIDPEKVGAKPAPRNLPYSLAKYYAFGMASVGS